MDKVNKDVIVLIPVFEDRRSAIKLFEELSSQIQPAPYVIAVDDGSIQDPLQKADLGASRGGGEILRLARNMGHQQAIAIGLTYIAMNFEPNAVVVMDSDGEDRPESIPALLQALRSGEVEAVVAQRRRRSETLSFRIFYTIYRLAFHLLTGRSIRFGNFTALSAAGVRRLAAMPELWVHVASSLMVSKLRIGAVETDRGKRYHGASHMNFVSLLLHGMRSLMVFAEDVLVRIGLFCIILACSSVMLLSATAILKLLDIATPGWFSTASGILVVILLQAGILTFVTLMIAGLVRSSSTVARSDLDRLIERIEKSPAGEWEPLTRAERRSV